MPSLEWLTALGAMAVAAFALRFAMPAQRTLTDPGPAVRDDPRTSTKSC